MTEYIQFGSIFLGIAMLFTWVNFLIKSSNNQGSFALNRIKHLYSIFFILTAFRHEDIGTDTKDYIQIFHWFQLSDSNGRYELIFSELTRLLGSYTSDFRLFLAFFSALSSDHNLFFFLSQNQMNVLYAILLFFIIFFVDYVTMLRQSIAISNNNDRNYISSAK